MSDNIVKAEYKVNELATWGGVHTRHIQPFRDLIDHAKALEKELAYLRYFHQEADFGPAHEDVVDLINQGYDGEVPEAYAAN